MWRDDVTRGRPTPIAALAGHFPDLPLPDTHPDPNYRMGEEHLKDLKVVTEKKRKPDYVGGVSRFEEAEE